MAYFFGDGFDLYALPADALLGYWDGGSINFTLTAGRFSASRGITVSGGSNTTTQLFKNGANDAVHHVVVAIQLTAAITGTSILPWFTFYDGATAQCSIVFRSDGVILLTSGSAGGATLATYSGAIIASNTWYAFEIEINISNTAGYMNVRKNGNTSNDFASATNLNTRAGTANNYANRLGVGSASANHVIDDFLWRSDTAGVPWVGDIRCYTRRPDTDAAAAWTRPSTFQMQPYAGTTTTSAVATAPRYTSFISQGGAIGSVVVNLNTGYTGNMKCALYTSTVPAGGGQPNAVLQAATSAINNPIAGANTFTFSPPVVIPKGTQFFEAHISDVASGSITQSQTAPYSTAGFSGTGTYAAFPAAPAGLSASTQFSVFPVVTPTYNADAVSEPYEDAAASYVYSSTVGQADLYTLTGIDSTPTVIIGVTTRGLLQKSDAGTRNVAVQLKSGGTTVESATAALNTTWGHVYRTDLVDPATGAAWTPTAVNNLQIGAVVKA